MMKFYYLLLLNLVFLIGVSVYSEERTNFFHVKSKKYISIDSLHESFKDYDAIVFGEDHSDKNGRKIIYEILQKSLSNYKISLSLEIFEQDQQLVLNEYLSGILEEKYFKKEMRLWSNYNDYEFIVLLAKEKKIPIIAANAPERYVRLISRKPIHEFYSLSKEAKGYLPPFNSIFNIKDPEYENKIKELQSSHHIQSDLVAGQLLRDSSMAFFSAENHFQTGNKIFLINGKFHSDHYKGTFHRLHLYGLKTLLISMVPSQIKKIFPGELADVIIYSGISDN